MHYNDKLRLRLSTTVFPCSLPQNQVSTGFALGPHGNFTHDQTVILKQVYDRITQKDCVDFVNGILAENKVSKDLNELWKLTNKAVLNRWNGNLTAQDLGISAGEVKDIQTGFAGNKAERNKAERGQAFDSSILLDDLTARRIECRAHGQEGTH